MPGHKGLLRMGMEHLDITEIQGADSLYEASGIIAQSERNASDLFGCATYYSTEGSSQCIRAMLHLAMLYGKSAGREMRVLACRNAHKTFLSACALLDLKIDWYYSDENSSYLSCIPHAEKLTDVLSKMPNLPFAFYVTSPDYLGTMADIAEIAEACHQFGVLLLVDNAHGAYLRFLPESLHPMDLGADMCCDSAHKTLPVLTGGAYLHLASDLSDLVSNQAKHALALFGSTSPSYLILQSLDGVNPYLAEYPQLLMEFLHQLSTLKETLIKHGYCLVGNEPMKLTVSTKPYGYTGEALAERLLEDNIVCEFADADYLVLMLAPEIGHGGLERLKSCLLSIPRKTPILQMPPVPSMAQAVMSVREAMMSVCEDIPVEQCEGRTLAAASVGCPPAVPILVCGEKITQEAIACFQYYGIEYCTVVKE